VYVIVVALLGEVVVVVSEVNVGIDESVVTVAMLEAFAGPVLPAWSVTVFAKIQMLMTPWLHPVRVTEKVVENPELGVVEYALQPVPLGTVQLKSPGQSRPETGSLKVATQMLVLDAVKAGFPTSDTTTGALRSDTTPALVAAVTGPEFPEASDIEPAVSVIAAVDPSAHPVTVNEYGEALPVRVPIVQPVPLTVKSLAVRPVTTSLVAIV
jgi:hypothetical protein